MSKYYIIIILAAIFTVVAQMLLKISASKNISNGFRKTYLNIYVLTGYSVFTGVTVLNLYALREVPLLFMVIINATVQVLVVTCSSIFFKEKLNKKQILGLFIITLGVIVFNI
jgi:small multidrug resistance pump